MAKRASQPNLKPNASPDDIAACFSEYTSLRGDISRIQQKISITFGRYEKQGVDTKAIKHAYTESQKDPAEVAAKERKNAEYVRILGIIEIEKDGQGSFAAGLTITKPSGSAAEGLARARAHTDGYNSGKAGGKIDACRFNPGSEEYVAWRDGFDDGWSDRRAKNPGADKIVASTPRKPKRRAAAEAPATVN